MERSAATLFQGIAIERCVGSLDRTIHQLTYDSRQVQPHSLFVALQGRHYDGHDFIATAYAQGAEVVVGERPFEPPAGKTFIRVSNSRRILSQLASAFYDHPTKRLFTVGITGTKGKTSVTHFVAALLDRVDFLSTITNADDNLPNTTPESLELQRLASEALAKGKRHFICEVSAHALKHHRVEGIAWDVAVFTNLSQDHFDDFKGFDEYFETKALLFKHLKPEALAIVNVDDPYGKRLLEQTSARVMTYGLNESATIHATDIRTSKDRSQFDIHTPQGEMPLKLTFPGKFNIYNALAAVGVGLCANVPLERIKSRLEAITHLEGRFERYRMPNGTTVIADFAHSPDSLEKMLEFLKEHYPRVLTIFGCGGESDPYKRPLMGQISGTLSDHTILTHDNPKHEDPQEILDQIEAGLKAVTSAYEIIPDRRTAIRQALERVNPQDCVLVAGKGHERTQVFGTQEIPYHDGEFLVDILGAVPYRSK